MASLARVLAFAAATLALVGGIVSLVKSTALYSTYVLGAGVLLAVAAAWRASREDHAHMGEETKFSRELAMNAASMILLVVFILLALVEILAIPAAMGYLVVFSRVGLGFIDFFGALSALLLIALAWAVVLASNGSLRRMTKSEDMLGRAAAIVTGVFVLGAFVVATGAFDRFGLHSERAVFVVAASLVSFFTTIKAWLRLPAYAEVTEWLERNERLRQSGLLRKLIYVLVGMAGVGVVLSLVPAFGLAPRGVGIFGMGIAMLALLAATFNVGVSHIVPRLEIGMDNAADHRRKRKIVLSAVSIVLSFLGGAIAILTFLAFLAQAAKVQVFAFLLAAYVTYYIGIFAVALVPLCAAILVRTRFQSEVPYSDRLRAQAIMGAALTIILVFFAVFIGSGLAEGSGILIENAVLVMGAAILSLILFVKSRTLLPSVTSLLRDAVKSSAGADTDKAEQIKNRMIATYVTALVFVLGFVGYFVATTLGVVPSPQSSLGTDLGFFVYLLLGLALLVVVAMRYMQNVNMDPRWSKVKENATIGKRRLTSEQVQRYLILGFSIGAATLLAAIGALGMAGLIATVGPLDAKKYSTDFFVFAILIGIGPYGWYAQREAKRTEAIDQTFPEFLRDLAESQRAGMTLTEAVITASKGSYGMLTPEIRKMAAQIEWGVSFSDALERFSDRVRTQLISRTVSLVIQASNAGGNVVDVLTAAADDAREIQQIVRERNQQMSIYVMIIYIAFAVFVGVIAVLNAQFIPEVAKAVAKADGVSIGGLNFRKFDENDFKTLFFHAAVIQGLGGGIVGGVMSKGKLVHGLRHSFILVFLAWVLFRLVIG